MMIQASVELEKRFEGPGQRSEGLEKRSKRASNWRKGSKDWRKGPKEHRTGEKVRRTGEKVRNIIELEKKFEGLEKRSKGLEKRSKRLEKRSMLRSNRYEGSEVFKVRFLASFLRALCGFLHFRGLETISNREEKKLQQMCGTEIATDEGANRILMIAIPLVQVTAM